MSGIQRRGEQKQKPVDYATALTTLTHTHRHTHIHSLIRIFTFSSFSGRGDAIGIFYASAILSRANTLPPFIASACAPYVLCALPSQARTEQALRRIRHTSLPVYVWHVNNQQHVSPPPPRQPHVLSSSLLSSSLRLFHLFLLPAGETEGGSSCSFFCLCCCFLHVSYINHGLLESWPLFNARTARPVMRLSLRHN